MSRPHPIDREVPFEVQELFFSRTDEHGVIEQGNAVFVRVSCYPREHLIGAPHNVIRHPDMPKCVFRYFWETIQGGQPIVAYVKNLAADGRYYWVVAAAFPVQGGYVSIRMKPTAGILAKVEPLYRELLGIEQNGGVDKAYETLFARLKELGFPSYRDFARAALVAELESRDKALATGGRSAVELSAVHSGGIGRLLISAMRSISASRARYAEIFAKLARIDAAKRELQKTASDIGESYQTIRHLSVNMAVESERAGSEGRSLAVISETFRRWADEVHTSLHGFLESATRIAVNLDGAMFSVAASRVQIEMMDFLAGEMAGDLVGRRLAYDDPEAYGQFSMFSGLAVDATTGASDQLTPVVADVARLRGQVDSLREAISALFIVRQNGRMETARMKVAVDAFNNHLDGMAAFVNFVSDGIKSLEACVYSLADDLRTSSQLLSKVQGEFRVIRESAATSATRAGAARKAA